MANESKTEVAAGGSEPVDSKLRLGLETTLLAWSRTGLALMGFGFVLARFGLFLREWAEASHVSSRQIRVSLTFGVLLILLGVAVNVVAAWMHYPYLVRTRSGETDLPHTWKLALFLSAMQAVAGLAMAVLLVVMSRA
jgi:putative membrane protein